MAKKAAVKHTPSTQPAKAQAGKTQDNAGKKAMETKQDHEMPSAKEVANNARQAAHGVKLAPEAAPPRKPSKNAARANVARDKRPSALDLAAGILVESKQPLGAKALAERVIAAGWQTTGRTPEATLYSAISREIKAKANASRFAKAGKGLFTARAQ